MRDTGVIRRIDELGRIVIPKEIRKTLRIREGDPLEIYTNDGELIFKKYSPILNIKDIASGVCDCLYELTEKVCFVTDNDEVLYFSKNKNKDLVGSKNSSALDKIIKDRKSVVLSKKDGSETLSLFNGSNLKMENQIIIPIISNGDAYGSLVLYDEKENESIGENEIKLCRLSANVIARYFE
ncbi:MAG: AbrB/MazE/SpoVT family DNA-binding domain-containing protein [Firmicutes bacterium]|nr:AbrB/MazE/SpoVT family DNA-binding domain-containing protein [Candidatus Caballimonas caccae]